MHPLESTWNGSATKRMTNAGGVAAEAGQWPRHGNTSSATAAGGETCKGHYGRWWDRHGAGKPAEADTYRSLSCYPYKIATKQWWTSLRLRKLGCSHWNERQFGGDAEDDSGAERRQRWGYISVPFVPFIFSPYVQFIFTIVLSFKFHIYQWGWMVAGGGGSSTILPARPEAEGVLGPVIH